MLVRADNETSLRAVETYVERFGGSRDCRLRNWWTMGTDDPVDAVRFTIPRSAYDPAAARTNVAFVG